MKKQTSKKKHHKRKPHPRPVMTKPEPIKVINENGEVIHEATLTPADPLQAFIIVSKIWMYQKGVTPADIAEHAIKAASEMMNCYVSFLYDVDPKRADKFMEQLYAETETEAKAIPEPLPVISSSAPWQPIGAHRAPDPGEERQTKATQ